MSAAKTQGAQGTGFKRVQVEKGIRQIGPHKWEVQVHVGRDPLTRKLRQMSRSTTGGIRVARNLRSEMITEVAKNHADTASVVNSEADVAKTLAHLLDKWVAHGERRGRSPSTIDGYRKKIDAVIRPELGAVAVTDITSEMLDAFYDRLLDGGKTPATVMHYHRIISAALTQARKWKAVGVNVAQDATPPSVELKALTVPPPERVQALIELAAASRSPEWATVITLAAFTGLRRGELCGLQWGDVDWQEQSVTVHRSIWQTKDGWGAKEPKTHQVRRVILGPATMAVLAGRHKRFTDDANLAEVPLREDAYVISPDIGGARPMMPSTVTLAFGRLCKRMAETTGEPWPYRFHDLRHYTGTEMDRSGYSARTIADRLGHRNPALTQRVYIHETEDRARSGAESLEAGLSLPRSLTA
ncbi:MAG: tyrosine-type recombinase/integrase [Acidimicrobiales bacterium]